MRLEYKLRGAGGSGSRASGAEMSASLSAGSGRVTVDDRTFAVEVVSVGPRYLHFKLDGRLCKVPFVRDHGRLLFWVGGNALEFSARGDDDAEPEAPAGGFIPQVHAPMPGKVLSVEVEVGQELAIDDPLVLLEAMKMETTIRATAACRVLELRVQAGQLVAQDEVLLLLEQIADEPTSVPR